MSFTMNHRKHEVKSQCDLNERTAISHHRTQFSLYFQTHIQLNLKDIKTQSKQIH